MLRSGAPPPAALDASKERGLERGLSPLWAHGEQLATDLPADLTWLSGTLHGICQHLLAASNALDAAVVEDPAGLRAPGVLSHPRAQCMHMLADDGDGDGARAATPHARALPLHRQIFDAACALASARAYSVVGGSADAHRDEYVPRFLRTPLSSQPHLGMSWCSTSMACQRGEVLNVFDVAFVNQCPMMIITVGYEAPWSLEL